MKDALQITPQSIKSLQTQIDSLKNVQVISELKYRAIEKQEVISQVNEFYDKSWSGLLWLIGILVGIFGLILPIISQLISNWNQRKNLKELTDTISNQLTNVFDSKLEELVEKYNEEVKRLEDEFAKRSDQLELMNNDAVFAAEAGNYALVAQSYYDKSNDFEGMYWMLASYFLYEKINYDKRANECLKIFIQTLNEYDNEEFNLNKEQLLHPQFENQDFDEVMQSIIDTEKDSIKESALELKKLLELKVIHK